MGMVRYSYEEMMLLRLLELNTLLPHLALLVRTYFACGSVFADG